MGSCCATQNGETAGVDSSSSDDRKGKATGRDVADGKRKDKEPIVPVDPIPSTSFYSQCKLGAIGRAFRELVETDRLDPLPLHEVIVMFAKLRVAMMDAVPSKENSSGTTAGVDSLVATDLKSLLQSAEEIPLVHLALEEAGRQQEGEMSTARKVSEAQLCAHLGLRLGEEETETAEEVPSELALVAQAVTQALDTLLEQFFNEVPSIREEIFSGSTFLCHEFSTQRLLEDLVETFSSARTQAFYRWNPLCDTFRQATKEAHNKILASSPGMKNGSGSPSSQNLSTSSALYESLSKLKLGRNSLEIFSMVRACTETAILLVQFLLGAYEQNYALLDPLTTLDEEAFTSRILSQLLSAFTNYGCADPIRGMEIAEVVEEETSFLRSILFLVGALGDTTTKHAMTHRFQRNVDAANADSVQSWAMELPFPLLDVPACRTVLYLCAVVTGQNRLSTKPLFRQRVLHDLFHTLKSAKNPPFVFGPLETMDGSEGTTYKLFPLFASSLAEMHPHEHRQELDEGEGTAVEPGEGHGPRKEIFDVCADALVQEYAAAVDMSPYASAFLSRHEPLIHIRFFNEKCASAVTRYLKEGNKLHFMLGDAEETADPWSCVITNAYEPRKGLHVKVRVDSRASVSLENVAFSVQEKQQPCFLLQEGSSFVWFNPAHEDEDCVRPSSTNFSAASKEVGLYHSCFLAGWLLGEALTNGVVFPILFPPFFLQEVLCRVQDRAPDDAMSSTYRSGILEYSGNHSGLASPKKSPSAVEEPPSTSLFCPTEQHLSLLNDEQKGVNDALRRMTGKEFEGFLREVIELDGTSDEEATQELLHRYKGNVEGYIREYVVERMLFQDIRRRLDAVADGLFASRIPSLPCTAYIPHSKLSDAVIGRTDTPQDEFVFSDEFAIDFEGAFAETRRNFLFKKMIVDFFEERWEPYGVELPTLAPSAVHFNRTLLRFITGRQLLPATARSEKIRIRLVTLDSVDSHISAHEDSERCYQLFTRLPTSHTCDNGFEVPDYLTAYLFSTNGPFAGGDPQEAADDLWKALPNADKKQTKCNVFRALVERTALAAYNAKSYELDVLDNVDDGGRSSSSSNASVQEQEASALPSPGVGEEVLPVDVGRDNHVPRNDEVGDEEEYEDDEEYDEVEEDGVAAVAPAEQNAAVPAEFSAVIPPPALHSAPPRPHSQPVVQSQVSAQQKAVPAASHFDDADSLEEDQSAHSTGSSRDNDDSSSSDSEGSERSNPLVGRKKPMISIL